MKIKIILLCGLALLITAGCTSFSGRRSVLKSEFIFTKAPFPSCHASTIVETTNGLLAGWFGGTAERNPDVCIWTARLNNGRWMVPTLRSPRDIATYGKPKPVAAWTQPMEVANGVGFATNRLPTWNPVLFQPANGPLMLFYKVGPSPAGWWGMMKTSADAGETWSFAHRLPDEILGPIKNKPIQLANGDILCGSSTEGKDGWRTHFERTADGGQTWTRTPPVNGTNIHAIQASILFHKNGSLQAVGRTREEKIFSITSNDDGKNWGEMTLLDLPNPNSGTDAVTLQDGRQLLVYNHNTRDGSRNKGRSPLNVAVSPDGTNWFAALVLEDDLNAPNGFAYPAVIQTSDGLVHIAYTWERKRIKHVVLDPAKLKLRPIKNGEWPQ